MANFKEFGTVIEESQPGFKEFGEVVEESAPLSGKKAPFASLAGQKRAGKQAAAGIAKFFQAIGGIPHERGLEKILSQSEEGRTPLVAALEGPEEEVDLSDRIVQGISGGAVSGPAMGISPLLSALSGGAAEVGHEAGGPAGGLVGGLLPFLLSKGKAGAKEPFKIVPKGKEQAQQLETIRRYGGDEASLSTLFKPKKAVRGVAKVARKGKKIEQYGRDLEKAVGDLYEPLEKEFAKEGPLLPGQKQAINKGISKLEAKISKSLAGKKLKDVKDILFDVEKDVLKKGATAESLMNAYTKLNRNIPWGQVKQGHKLRAAAAKNIFLKEMKEINPVLAKDFQTVNKLYANMKEVRKVLEPGATSKYFTLIEAYPAVKALFTLNLGALPPALAKFGALEGGREVLGKYITSPHTQGMLTKMARLVNQNKKEAAAAIARQLDKEINELPETRG